MKKKLAVIASILLLTFGASSNGMSQWVQTNGPYGGSFASFATMGSNLFAVSNSELFRSTNNGAHWTSVVTPGKSQVGSIFVSSGRLFAVTGPGLCYTTDLGLQWVPVQDTTLKFVSLTWIQAVGTTLFMGDGSYSFTPNDGLFRSTDNGDTWAASGTGITNTHVHAFAAIGTNLFAGTSAGIFLSTDNGSNWKLVDTALSHSYIHGLASSGTILFAGTWTYPSENYDFIRSTDSGQSWAPFRASLVDSLTEPYGTIGNDLYVYSRNGFSRTTDKGLSWSDIHLPHIGYAQYLDTIGSDLWVGTSSGPFLSNDDGVTWSSIASDIISQNAITLSVDPGGRSLYALMDGFGSGSGSIFLSTDDGTSWSRDTSGWSSTPFSFTKHGSNLIAATGGGIYLSTNSGSVWTRTGDSAAWSCRVFAEVGPNLFIANGTGVYRSTDDGLNWEPVNQGLSGPYYWSDSTYIISLTSNGTTLFAGTEASGIYRLTENSDVWTQVVNGLPWEESANTLTTVGTNLLASIGASVPNTDSSGVYLSTDNGESWAKVTVGLPAGQRFDQLVVSDKKILGLIQRNVFLSTDDGVSWTSVDTGNGINVLAIKGSNVFAGRTQPGVWRRPLAELLGTSSVSDKLPAMHDIQSYPNPFSQSTQITFTSQAAGYAEVSIVNMLGEQVARVFSGELDAGQHNFTFSNTTALPEGMYECLMRLNGRVETLPIVLLH